MTFVNYKADIFLVNFFLTPVATGIYVIAVQMAEKLWMLSQAASTVLLPRLSSMRSDPIARYQLTMRTVYIVGLLTFISSLFLAIGLFFLLDPIFGESYKKSFMPFIYLLPGVLALAISRIKSNCIAAAGKPEWNFYASIFTVTLNISLNVLIIPIYGIVGAAIATTIAYSSDSAIKFYLIRKTIQIKN